MILTKLSWGCEITHFVMTSTKAILKRVQWYNLNGFRVTFFTYKMRMKYSGLESGKIQFYGGNIYLPFKKLERYYYWLDVYSYVWWFECIERYYDYITLKDNSNHTGFEKDGVALLEQIVTLFDKLYETEQHKILRKTHRNRGNKCFVEHDTLWVMHNNLFNYIYKLFRVWGVFA